MNFQFGNRGWALDLTVAHLYEQDQDQGAIAPSRQSCDVGDIAWSRLE